MKRIGIIGVGEYLPKRVLDFYIRKTPIRVSSSFNIKNQELVSYGIIKRIETKSVEISPEKSSLRYEITPLGRLLLKCVQQRLAVEYALLVQKNPFVEPVIQNLPPLVRFGIMLRKGIGLTKSGISKALRLSEPQVDAFLDEVLPMFGIDFWTWKQGTLTWDQEGQMTIFKELVSRSDVWSQLRAGGIVKSSILIGRERYPQKIQEGSIKKIIEDLNLEKDLDPKDLGKMLDDLREILHPDTKFVFDLEKYAPISGLFPEIWSEIFTPKKADEIAQRPKFPFNIIKGPIGLGKTILLGQIAIKWLELGKKVIYIDTFGELPQTYPFDDVHLIILDDLENYPPKMLLQLIQWSLAGMCFIIATAHSENWDSFLKEVKDSPEWPSKDPVAIIKEYSLRDWSNEELKDLLDHVSKVYSVEVPKELIESLVFKADGNPCWLTSIVKKVSLYTSVVEPGDLYTLTPQMQIKYLRTLMLTLTNSEGEWKNEYSQPLLDAILILILTNKVSGIVAFPKIYIEAVVKRIAERDNLDADKLNKMLFQFLKPYSKPNLSKIELPISSSYAASDYYLSRFPHYLSNLKLYSFNHHTVLNLFTQTVQNSSRIDFPPSALESPQFKKYIKYPIAGWIVYVYVKEGIESQMDSERFFKIIKYANIFANLSIHEQLYKESLLIARSLARSQTNELLSWQAVIYCFPYYFRDEGVDDFRFLFPVDFWDENKLILRFQELDLNAKLNFIQTLLHAVERMQKHMSTGEVLRIILKLLDEIPDKISLDDKKFLIMLKFWTSYFFSLLEEYDIALNLLEDCLKRAYDLKAILLIPHIYEELIAISRLLRDEETAREYTQQAEEILSDDHTPLSRANIYYQAGMNELNAKNLSSAIGYFRKAEEIYSKSSELSEKLLITRFHIFEIHVLMEKTQEAQELLEEILNNFKLHIFEVTRNLEYLFELIRKLRSLTELRPDLEEKIGSIKKSVVDYSFNKIMMDTNIPKIDKLKLTIDRLLFEEKNGEALAIINQEISQQDINETQKIELLSLRISVLHSMEKYDLIHSDLEEIIAFHRKNNNLLELASWFQYKASLFHEEGKIVEEVKCLLDLYSIMKTLDKSRALNLLETIKQIMLNNEISICRSNTCEARIENSQLKIIDLD